MNFQDYLLASSNEISKRKEQYLRRLLSGFETQAPQLSRLYSLFRQSMQGGKVLRGTLVKLGYELVQGSSTQDIFKPALAIEILHSCLLIHDDIIDESPLRRGKPTIHNALGNTHYGISQTLCLGNLGFFLTMRLLAESNFDDKRK